MTTTTSSMGKRVRQIALPLLIALNVAGCAALPSGYSGRGLTPSEKMMWSTYAFGTKHGVATCFIVHRQDSSEPGGTVAVVVTAAHILATAPKGPFYLVARMPDGSNDPQAMLFELRPPQSPDPIFVKHPFYDIGAFEIRIPAQLAQVISFPSFLNENTIGAGPAHPRVGENVLFLGFPKVAPGTVGGFPILRAGRVGSYSVDQRQRRFLINADIYPGDSGGPVFAARRGGKPRLLGMVTARGGRKPDEVIPLAIALDVNVIRETLALVAERARRINATASSNGVAAKNVAQSGPGARTAGQWEVLSPGDASRDLVKDAPTLDAEIHER